LKGDGPVFALEETCDGSVEITDVESISVRRASLSIFDGHEVIPMRSAAAFENASSWFRHVAARVRTRIEFVENGEDDNEENSPPRECSLASIRSPLKRRAGRRHPLTGTHFLVAGFTSASHPTLDDVRRQVQNLGGTLHASCSEVYEAIESEKINIHDVYTITMPNVHRTVKYLFAVANFNSGGAPVHPAWLESVIPVKTASNEGDEERRKCMYKSMSPFHLPCG